MWLSLRNASCSSLHNSSYAICIGWCKYCKSRIYSALASWLLTSICSQVNKGLIGMTAYSIWSKLHQVFSSSSTTRNMSLYDRFKARKLPHLSMRDYLAKIQSICDRLASYGHLIEEIQYINYSEWSERSIR